MAKSDQSITRSAREIILGDGISTLVFMVVNSVWNELAAMLAVALGMKMRTTGLMVLITGLMLYCPFSDAVFGAGTSFNPLNNAAFAAAGRGPVALHLGRMAAQALGGATGTAVALRWVPRSWQGRFRTFDQGIKAGVSLTTGAACEGVLSFAINMVILWSLNTRHKRLGYLAPLAATAVLVLAGWPTGPAMNSAWIFGWWVHFRSHSAVEHMIIYWLAPLAGAGLAGALWSFLSVPRRRPRPGLKGVRAPRVPASKETTSGKALALQTTAAAGQNKKAD